MYGTEDDFFELYGSAIGAEKYDGQESSDNCSFENAVREER